MVPPPLASARSRRTFAARFAPALLGLLLMGYFIHEPYQAQATAPPDTADARQRLENGDAAQRRQALLELVAAKAEDQLALCLASANPGVVRLAVAGLWECWLNEQGTAARAALDAGTEDMNAGDLDAASAAFTKLMAQYPQWAEAVNKQATVLYLQGRPEDSIALCRRVVALKPDHFGAWNGLALCAIQIEDWSLAMRAVRESLRLQPKSPANLQLLKLVESRLPQA